jgi:enoyl-CoA hydratase/carnithine racemase
VTGCSAPSVELFVNALFQSPLAPLRCERRGSTLWLTACNGPVNALSLPVRQRLLEGVLAGSVDASVTAIVVHGEGRTFFAGADLAELDNGMQSPGLLEFVTACERAPKPVIAAMHGTVFGGGVVVACAGDYRIAARDTRFAMPEVGLGLLPTFGGTQYLPRLVGIEAALQLIIDGATWDAQRACQAGLVDEIVPTQDLLTAAAARARRTPPKRLVRDATAHLAELPSAAEAFDRRRHALAVSAPDFEAPRVCLDVMEAGLQMPLAEALRCEHAAFVRLLQSAQSRRLRQLFFADRKLRRGGFDRGAVEHQLRLVGRDPTDLLRISRALLQEGAAPDAATLDALIVALTGAPRYAPSAIEALLKEQP